MSDIGATAAAVGGVASPKGSVVSESVATVGVVVAVVVVAAAGRRAFVDADLGEVPPPPPPLATKLAHDPGLGADKDVVADDDDAAVVPDAA